MRGIIFLKENIYEMIFEEKVEKIDSMKITNKIREFGKGKTEINPEELKQFLNDSNLDIEISKIY